MNPTQLFPRYIPKKIAIVLLFVSLCIVAISFYFSFRNIQASLFTIGSSTKSTTPNAPWQTYDDKKNGFLFKYPPTWTKNETGFDTGKGIVTLTVEAKSMADTLNFLNYEYEGNRYSSEVTKDTVHGFEIAKVITTLYELNTKTNEETIRSKSYLLIIPLADDKTLTLVSELTEKQTLDKILQTFTFTRPTQPPFKPE